MMGAYVIGIVVMLVSMLVSWQLKSRFQKYSKTPLANGMSGAEVAQHMLQDHGISNVRVVSVAGQLTDHYNPANRTVNLSEPVYHGATLPPWQWPRTSAGTPCNMPRPTAGSPCAASWSRWCRCPAPSCRG